MAFANAARDGILDCLLNAVTYTGLMRDDAGGETSLYVHLHTASPGVGGTSSTNEATYTGYARVAVARSSGAPFWTVTSGVASASADIVFPIATGGSEELPYASVAQNDGTLIALAVLVTPFIIVAGARPTITDDAQFSLA